MIKHELSLKVIEARNAIALARRLVGEVCEEAPRRTKLTNAWYHLKDAGAALAKFCEGEDVIGGRHVRPRKIR